MKISFSQDETPWIFHVHVNLTQGSYSSWWLQTDLANRSSPRLIILNIVANYSSWWSTLPNGFLMEISWVMGVPPKSFILIGCSIINHLFWGIPIYGRPHIMIYDILNGWSNPMGSGSHLPFFLWSRFLCNLVLRILFASLLEFCQQNTTGDVGDVARMRWKSLEMIQWTNESMMNQCTNEPKISESYEDAMFWRWRSRSTSYFHVHSRARGFESFHVIPIPLSAS